MKSKLLLFPGSVPPSHIDSMTPLGYTMYGGAYFAGPYKPEDFERRIKPALQKAIEKGDVDRPLIVEVEEMPR